MKRILFTFLFLAVFSAGCSVYRIDSKDTSPDYYVPKTSIDNVAYIEKVDKPYTEIGIVTVTTQRCQSWQDVLPKLKQEAGILGADAITDVQTGNAYIRTTYTARAIVWK